MNKYTAIVEDIGVDEIQIVQFEADYPDDEKKIMLVMNAYLNRDENIHPDEWVTDIEVLAAFSGWLDALVDRTTLDIVCEDDVDLEKGIQR